MAAAGQAEDFLREVGRHQPDVVVDVRMPPTFTDEGLRAALVVRGRWPDVGVLVLSQYVEERYATELLSERAQGVGYLLKDRVADLSEFLGALDRVAAGGSALDPEVVAQLLACSRHPLAALTARERDVLALMAEAAPTQPSRPRSSLARARWRSTSTASSRSSVWPPPTGTTGGCSPCCATWERIRALAASMPMRPARRVILILGVPVAFALLLAFAYNAVTQTYQVEYHVHISAPPGDQQARVSIDNADAIVRPGADSRIVVDGTLRGSLRRPAFSWRPAAAGLVLHSSCLLGFTGSCTMAYDVSMPRGLRVAVTDATGNLTVSGFSGQVTLSDGSGDVSIGY